MKNASDFQNSLGWEARAALYENADRNIPIPYALLQTWPAGGSPISELLGLYNTVAEAQVRYDEVMEDILIMYPDDAPEDYLMNKPTLDIIESHF